MSRSLIRCVVVLVCGLLAIAPSALAQTGSQFFPETGQTVTDPFLSFWRSEGGLPVFGYPITAEQPEFNRDTGGTFPTQWFERNRFELHPENKPPYNILLGRLGDDRLRQLQIDWQQYPRETGPRTGCRWFPETGYNVCNQATNLGFKQFWEGHGLNDPLLDRYSQSLALFGLPLTGARMERNSSGDEVLTQWFERARFEWHPTNPDQYKVLLGLLGREVQGAALQSEPLQPVAFGNPTTGSTGIVTILGKATNTKNQQLTVEVSGRNLAAVAEYARSLNVAFDAVAVDPAPNPNSAQVDSPIPQQLLAQNPNNLVIKFDLIREQAFALGPAYQLRYLIDPQIGAGVTHDYPKRCGVTISSVIVTTESGGVQGQVWQDAKAASAIKIYGGSASYLPVPPPNGGTHAYDLAVLGLNGASKYAVSGAWTRRVDETPPGGGSCY